MLIFLALSPLKFESEAKPKNVESTTVPPVKPAQVNSNINLSEKLKKEIELKDELDPTSRYEKKNVKIEPDTLIPQKVEIDPNPDPMIPDLLVPKLEPVFPDLLSNDVFNEVEITSEVEICTTEDTSKPLVKEEVVNVVDSDVLDEGRSMDSISTMDQDASNDAIGISHDSSSCETSSNPDKHNMLVDDNSQSSFSKQSSVEDDDMDMTSVKIEQPVERIVKSECESKGVNVITTTTTTSTTTVTTQQVTSVDGVIKAVKTTESVASEISKTVK